jgi:hypothetical protein
MGLPKYRRVQRCIFCPNPAKSGEHGWSAWAIKRFSTSQSRISGHIDGQPHFDRHQRAIKIKCVCGECNSGWMKKLEDSVIPTVGTMGDGDHASLNIPQQWTIAMWATAKAMVWEHIARTNTIFYTDEERANLRSGSLPPNTVVWLSAHVGRETFFSQANGASSFPGIVPHLELHFTTFAYQRLVIQIMTVRPYEQTDPYALINCNQRKWQRSIIRIWPTTSGAFWPPAEPLDDGMLESFHKRCGVGDSPED